MAKKSGDTAAGVESPAGRKSLPKRLLNLAITGLLVLLLAVGICIMFYPSISDYVNETRQTQAISGYKRAVREITVTDYSEIFAAARIYNENLARSPLPIEKLLKMGQKDVDRKTEYWGLLNVAGDGMIGYIRIDSLGINLPIYHGMSDRVLAKSAGHMQGTSLPIGGDSTHAIVSGHTGLPSAKLFTGIDKLKPGDTFTLYILNEVLTYQVDQVIKVLPTEVDELQIFEGDDYVTLMTCTPYGINSHRLFVRGERTENPPEAIELDEEEDIESVEELSWLSRVHKKFMDILSAIVLTVATWLKGVSEWVMELFGVEY